MVEYVGLLLSRDSCEILVIIAVTTRISYPNLTVNNSSRHR